MTMVGKGPHQYLNDTERRELAQIIERSTAGADRQRALELLLRAYADTRHGRDIGASLRQDLRTARQQRDSAQALVAAAIKFARFQQKCGDHQANGLAQAFLEKLGVPSEELARPAGSPPVEP